MKAAAEETDLRVESTDKAEAAEKKNEQDAACQGDQLKELIRESRIAFLVHGAA